MNSSINKRGGRNESLDALKAFSAIGVVLIHFGFPGDFGIIVQVCARVGVPIFFMCSGYYIESETINYEKIKKKIIHNVKILMFAIILYLIFNVLNDGLKSLVKNISIGNIAKFLLFNAPQISAAHLWFVSALIYSYLLFFFIYEARLLKKRIQISAVLLMVHIFIAEFLPIFGMRLPHPVVRNAYLLGVPFLLIGNWLRDNEELAGNNIIKERFLKNIVVLGILASCIEKYLLSPNDLLELYVGSIISSVGLFLICIKKPKCKCKTMAYIGRKYSLGIYILHPLVGTLIGRKVEDMYGFLWWRSTIIILISIIVWRLVESILKSKWMNEMKKGIG